MKFESFVDYEFSKMKILRPGALGGNKIAATAIFTEPKNAQLDCKSMYLNDNF